MSDSVRPQRRQPTRLPRPWDSPGKNTGRIAKLFHSSYDFAGVAFQCNNIYIYIYIYIFFFFNKKALYPTPSLYLGVSQALCCWLHCCQARLWTHNLALPANFLSPCLFLSKDSVIPDPRPNPFHVWLGTSDWVALGSFSSLAKWDKNSSSLQGFVILKTNTHTLGTSLVVQWPRPCIPNAGGPVFDPWSGS